MGNIVVGTIPQAKYRVDCGYPKKELRSLAVLKRRTVRLPMSVALCDSLSNDRCTPPTQSASPPHQDRKGTGPLTTMRKITYPFARYTPRVSAGSPFVC